MPKFRKKPVVIEAMRWDGSRETAENICLAFGPDVMVKTGSSGIRGTILECRTLEGALNATPGDWIVKGIKSNLSADLSWRLFPHVKPTWRTQGRVTSAASARERLGLGSRRVRKCR